MYSWLLRVANLGETRPRPYQEELLRSATCGKYASETRIPGAGHLVRTIFSESMWCAQRVTCRYYKHTLVASPFPFSPRFILGYNIPLEKHDVAFDPKVFERQERLK